MRMAVSRFRSCERSFWHATTMPVGRCAIRPSQVHAHEHLGPVLRLGAAGAGVDREDGVLPVLGAGEHDLELERLELAAHARQPFLDLRAEALVARLDGHLPQELRLRRLAGEVVEGAYRARELRSL